MGTKKSSPRVWKREHKIAFAGICITATGILLTTLVSLNKNSPAVSKNTVAVEVHDSPGAVIPTMVGSPNSTQIVDLKERTLFAPPEKQITKEVSKRLTQLKLNHPQFTVRLEVESNSSQRFKVAQILGVLLSTNDLGGFSQGTNIGISPSHPITIFFGQEEDDLARELSKAIEPFIQGTTLFTKVTHLGTNVCRLYLNGTPTFHNNGQVIFE